MNQYSEKRIIFMGTPDFSVKPLEQLVTCGYQVVGVVTQPDKPKGRGKSFLPTPVKEKAEELGLPVYQPKKVREPEFVELLRSLAPDVIVVAAFGQIIPKSILEMPEHGCLNLHASLLPKYRGAAPIQYAVIDGEKESGVTLMQMGEGLDTGDMISKVIVPITENTTGGSLFEELSEAGAALLTETLPSVFDGTAVRTPQPAESPTPYAAMIRKEMGQLDFSRTAEELERLVRGMNPWPSAYTFLNGKQLKVWSSRVVRTEEVPAAAPGRILRADPQGILVSCGTDALLLTEVQLEGKKRMPADAFLRGYSVESGAVLAAQRE